MTDGLRFDGQVAIVTGAGRGMAREHARQLAARGAKIVVNDLGSETAGGGAEPGVAAAVVEEIVAAGGEAIANHDSVATEDGAGALVAGALAEWGRLDVVINSAGIFEMLPVAATDVENLNKHLQTNLVGTAAVCLAAWPHLLDAEYGRIVNTASTAPIAGMLERISYSSAKAGIIGLTRCLAHEGEGAGIKVNLVNPSGRTRMWLDLETGDELAEVPPRTDPDPYRPGLASPIYLVLAHADCPTSGESFNGGGGRVSRQFIADTRGLVGEDITPESLFAHWAEIVDERDYFVPTPSDPYRGDR